MRPAETQISLGIHPVWSESSLCTQWVAKELSFLHADSEDSDQTRGMPRLIWVFARRTGHFVGFVMRRLNCFYWDCSLHLPKKFSMIKMNQIHLLKIIRLSFQEELLDILLDIPMRMMDKKLSLLAGKILLYLAENPTVSSIYLPACLLTSLFVP